MHLRITMFNTVIKSASLSNENPMAQREKNDQGKFMQIYDEPLASNIRGARFPLSADRAISQLPDKSDFIRTAVIDKLIAEGLLEGSEKNCTEQS